MSSGVTLPLVQVSILVLKLGLVAVEDGVVSPLLFEQEQKFVVVLLLFRVLLEFLGPCRIWGGGGEKGGGKGKEGRGESIREGRGGGRGGRGGGGNTKEDWK